MKRISDYLTPGPDPPGLVPGVKKVGGERCLLPHKTFASTDTRSVGGEESMNRKYASRYAKRSRR